MQVRDDIPEHRLVLGCTRDSQIHVEMAAMTLLAAGTYDSVITKAYARFMAEVEIGNNWKAILERPPVWGIDETGTPCFVVGGLAQPKLEPVAPVAPVEDPAPELTMDEARDYNGAVMDDCVNS